MFKSLTYIKITVDLLLSSLPLVHQFRITQLFPDRKSWLCTLIASVSELRYTASFIHIHHFMRVVIPREASQHGEHLEMTRSHVGKIDFVSVLEQ